MIKLNNKTIQNANLPSDTNIFAKQFTGCVIILLIDFFSDYNQILLMKKSKDITGFQISLELLRYITFSQNIINLITQFYRIILYILGDLVPRTIIPFFNNIDVKKPRTIYNNKELESGFRRYMVKHIQKIDKTLEYIEKANYIISAKSKWYFNGMEIVGYIINLENRFPFRVKIAKILD